MTEKAFNEKCDRLLRFLKNNPETNWDIILIDTGIKKDDPVISFLKEKGFVFFSNNELRITVEGAAFISKTSFVEQVNKTVK